MSYNSNFRSVLETAGYSGGLNDMMVKSLQAETGLSTGNQNDLLFKHLVSLGYSGNIHDMHAQMLGDVYGVTGSYTDRLGAVLAAGNNPFVAAASDPYYSFTQFVSNYDTDASDAKGHPTTVVGTVSFDGNANFPDVQTAANRIVTTSAHSEFTVANTTTPFVLEAKAQLASNAGAGYPGLISLTPTAATGGTPQAHIGFLDNGWGGTVDNSLYLQIVGTTGNFAAGASNWSVGNTVWSKTNAAAGMYHYALVYDGTKFLMYVDGNLVFTINETGTRDAAAQYIRVGCHDTAAIFVSWRGPIAYARYTLGSDRGYSGSTITVPDDPLPES